MGDRKRIAVDLKLPMMLGQKPHWPALPTLGVPITINELTAEAAFYFDQDLPANATIALIQWQKTK